MKKRIQDFLNRLAGFLGAKVLMAWMRTLDYRSASDYPDLDPGLCAEGQQFIYLVWHEAVLCPLYLRSRCNIVTLASQHRDAEILSEMMQRLGMGVVRGSTTRGGAALRKLMELTRTNHCVITPDGPRGPRRTVAQGAIYLAMRLGIPVVAMGIAYERPWRLPTWDRFAIPKPFSRCRIVFGAPILVPSDSNREQLAEILAHVDAEFQRVTAAAEQWVESGDRKPNEQPLRSMRVADRTLRVDGPEAGVPRPSAALERRFAPTKG
jgi:lysophospholipid acyltransferase (LPLAT)-like uncharacterized protein